MTALPINWSGKTILIVEDVDSSRRYFEAALKLTHARLLYAVNGQEAFEMLEKHPEIDLILLDIYLPKVNGLEVLKHIRKHRPAVPVIVQTAYTGPLHESQAFEAGADLFLAKPISLESLYSEIDLLLNPSVQKH